MYLCHHMQKMCVDDFYRGTDYSTITLDMYDTCITLMKVMFLLRRFLLVGFSDRACAWRDLSLSYTHTHATCRQTGRRASRQARETDRSQRHCPGLGLGEGLGLSRLLLGFIAVYATGRGGRRHGSPCMALSPFTVTLSKRTDIDRAVCLYAMKRSPARV